MQLRSSIWLCAFIAFSLSSVARATEVVIACGSVGVEKQLCIDGSRRWSEMTGNTVKVDEMPDSASQRLAMYKILLHEQHDTIDVYQIDITWPVLLGQYFVDLNTYGVESAAFSNVLIQNNTVQGQLIALPWYVDAGLFYYRKDLLQKYQRAVPKTWAEMLETAQYIQAKEQQYNPAFFGLVFQGFDYEGLTCDLTEWLGSYNLSIPTKAEEQAPFRSMLVDVKSWVDKIAPKEVTSYKEEDTRMQFQQGNALFMRNWPYAWSLMNDESSAVHGKVGVTILPGNKAGASAATLGGWQLAVSKYSKHPELAVSLVKYLTGLQEQKIRFEYGYFPSRPAVYNVLQGEVSDLTIAMQEATAHFVVRPSTPVGKKYQNLSSLLYREVNAYLSGQQNDDTTVAKISHGIAELGLEGQKL